MEKISKSMLLYNALNNLGDLISKETIRNLRPHELYIYIYMMMILSLLALK